MAAAMLMMAAGCGTEATNDRPNSVTLIQPEAAVQTPAATAATTDAAAATTTQRTSAGSQTPTTAHSAGAAVDEAAHPDDASPAPNASETVCDAGEVVLEQYISDGDDGCRPEACELGRNRQGGCLRPEIEVPKTTLAPQPVGEPCKQPTAGDPLRFSSDSFDPDNRPLVHLGRGMWRVDICLRHNDRATGRPERLKVTLATPVVEDRPMDFWGPIDVIQAANGDWGSDDFRISYADPIPPLRLNVKTDGGGDWVVTFTQTAPEATN